MPGHSSSERTMENTPLKMERNKQMDPLISTQRSHLIGIFTADSTNPVLWHNRLWISSSNGSLQVNSRIRNCDANQVARHEKSLILQENLPYVSLPQSFSTAAVKPHTLTRAGPELCGTECWFITALATCRCSNPNPGCPNLSPREDPDIPLTGSLPQLLTLSSTMNTVHQHVSSRQAEYKCKYKFYRKLLRPNPHNSPTSPGFTPTHITDTPCLRSSAVGSGVPPFPTYPYSSFGKEQEGRWVRTSVLEQDSSGPGVSTINLRLH